MEKQKKKFLLMAVFMLSAFGALAQGNGSAGINEATQVLISTFDPSSHSLSPPSKW